MKTYTTPSLVVRGTAVAETHSSISGQVESAGQSNRKQPPLIGSVGFYL
jgi:hypothetical protein